MSRPRSNAQIVKHGGIAAGSPQHKILLALRPGGDITSRQMADRFGETASTHIDSLRKLGYVNASRRQDDVITLTATGRDIVSPTGPLARAKTLINYP